MRHLSLILAALAAFLALPAAAQEFPALTGRVVDAANVIPPDVETSLDAKLAAFEQQSQRQLVVATIPHLQGYEISDYGYQLGRHWGIGNKGRNDGAILIVAPNERKVRIEVGYGLEPVLTDGLSSLIVQNDILPRFKAGDMPGGIVAGTDALIKQLQLPPEEAAKVAQQADQRAQSSGGGIPVELIVWGIFLFFFFILPMLRGGRRGARRGIGPLGNIIMWEAGKAAARGLSGSGSSWGGGGGFGGGGFSGGGGSFGGGGASGSW